MITKMIVVRKDKTKETYFRVLSPTGNPLGDAAIKKLRENGYREMGGIHEKNDLHLFR